VLAKEGGEEAGSVASADINYYIQDG